MLLLQILQGWNMCTLLLPIGSGRLAPTPDGRRIGPLLCNMRTLLAAGVRAQLE